MGILSSINSNVRSSRLASKLPIGSRNKDQPRLTVAVRGGQLRLAIAVEHRVVWHRVTPLSPALCIAVSPRAC